MLPDLPVCSHMRREEVRRNGSLLIVNAGEGSGHRYGRSTVALVDTVNRSAEIG